MKGASLLDPVPSLLPPQLPPDSKLKKMKGSDWKGPVSIAFNLVAIPIAFYQVSFYKG